MQQESIMEYMCASIAGQMGTIAKLAGDDVCGDLAYRELHSSL